MFVGSLLVLTAILVLNVGVVYASTFYVTATVFGKNGTLGSGCGSGTSTSSGTWTITVTKINPKLSWVHIQVWTGTDCTTSTGTPVTGWTVGHAKVGDTFTTLLPAGTYAIELTLSGSTKSSLTLAVTPA